MTSASESRKRRIRLGGALTAGLLLLTACGGGGETAPTPAPAPAPAPAPDADPNAAPEPLSRTVKIAFSSAVPQVEKIPSIVAVEMMAADGFDAESIYFSQSNAPIEAVVRGDANFGSASASAVFTAINAGAPIKAIMQANGPNYVLVAPAGVTDPSGLQGLRTGIHAPVSSTTLYTRIALADYPDVEPEILVVPGSANRIQALAANELDASVIQFSDIQALEELAPGRFDIIWNFATENPELVDSVLFTSTALLERDPGLVQAVLEYQVRAVRSAYDDIPQLAVDIERLVPNMDAALASANATLYTDSVLWDPSGGLTIDSVDATVGALVENEIMRDVPSWLPPTLFDRGPLEAVLARLG